MATTAPRQGGAPSPAKIVAFPVTRSPHRTVIEDDVMEAILDRFGGMAFACYAILERHANCEGTCYRKQDTLAAQLGISDRQVRTILGRLEEAKFIERRERTNRFGMRSADEFYLPFHPKQPRTDGAEVVPEVIAEATRPATSGHKVVTHQVDEEVETGEDPPTPRRRAEYPADFEERFWPLYPTGRGTKKKAAEQWRRLSPADRSAAVAGLPKWLASDQWTKEGGRFVVWAERYLRDRVWENDPPPPVPSTPSPYRNGAKPYAEWTDEELLAWSAPPGHKGGVPFEVRQAQIRYYKEHGL